MPTAHLDERKLFDLLERQGFTTERTTDGFRVLAPNGGGTSEIHLSTLKSSDANRAWRNQVAQLKRIGVVFEEPKQLRREARGEHYCPWPECARSEQQGGAPWPYLRNVSRHVRAAHGEFPEDHPLRGTAPKQTRTKPVETNGHRKAGPVRTRHIEPQDPAVKIRKAINNLIRGAEIIREAASEIGDTLDAVMADKAAADRKVRKLEDIFGKAVDAL